MNKLKITMLSLALLGMAIFVGTSLATTQGATVTSDQTNQNNANQRW